MKDLKELLRAAKKTIPNEDTVGEGDLVHKSEVKSELKEIDRKSALVKKLLKYPTADDVIHSFSVQAARRMVYEMEEGKMSADRLRAAQMVLDRALGKPVDRVLNINAEIAQKSDQELDSTIKKLMNELGFKEGVDERKLILDEGTKREALEGASDGASAEGQKQTKELPTQ